MILRTLRWKRPHFRQLIEYILDDKGRAENDDSFALTHNLYSETNDIAGLVAEYKQQDTFRIRRKNGVILYHEILSFSPDDSPFITLAKLENIAQAYINIRNSKGICIAKPHINEAHPHIHFCWHGTELNSAKTLRMDNIEFKRVRIEMEKYQQQHFPELTHSLVYLDRVKEKSKKVKPQTNQRRANEGWLKNKGVPLDKEALKTRVNEWFNKSQSLSHFHQLLEADNIELYTYREKVCGVKTHRKYRFSTLGIDKERLLQLEDQHKKEESRMNDLNRISKSWGDLEQDWER